MLVNLVLRKGNEEANFMNFSFFFLLKFKFDGNNILQLTIYFKTDPLPSGLYCNVSIIKCFRVYSD